MDVADWGKACVYYMVITELFFFFYISFSSCLQVVTAIFPCIKYIMVLISGTKVTEGMEIFIETAPKKQGSKLN